MAYIGGFSIWDQDMCHVEKKASQKNCTKKWEPLHQIYIDGEGQLIGFRKIKRCLGTNKEMPITTSFPHPVL